VPYHATFVGSRAPIWHPGRVAERVKFDIYCRKSGQLINLYRINRTPSGLYLNETRNPMRATMKEVGEVKRGESGFTYHEEGNSWFKQRGDRRSMKRRETPLSDFVGARTIATAVHVVAEAGKIQALEASVKLRADDVVIDRPGPFGVEIILSDRALALDRDPKRPNSVLHTFDQVFPAILIEEFDAIEESGGVPIPTGRFPRTEPLVLGENLFFDHHGRI